MTVWEILSWCWRPKVVYLLLFYVLATSEVISGQVLTCDSAHLWRLYSTAPLGNQATSTMSQFPHSVTLSWHWANQSLPHPNNAEHLARKRQVSILFDSTGVWTHDRPHARPVLYRFAPVHTQVKSTWVHTVTYQNLSSYVLRCYQEVNSTRTTSSPSKGIVCCNLMFNSRRRVLMFSTWDHDVSSGYCVLHCYTVCFSFCAIYQIISWIAYAGHVICPL